jgi:hypothetical protein
MPTLLDQYEADLAVTLTPAQLAWASEDSELNDAERALIFPVIRSGGTIRQILQAAADSTLRHRELEYVALVVSDAGGQWTSTERIWSMIEILRAGA